MKIWRTLLFAVIALSLGLYIGLVERPRMAEEAEPDKLVKFDPERVSNLRIAYPQLPSVTLTRSDADWRLLEPLAADADDEAVRRLLEQIADTVAERRIPKAEAEAPAVYGLEDDGTQARVSMGLDDGTKLPDIVIGNTTPVGFQAFVRVEGKEEIVLVPLLLHTGVKKTPLELREKKLFDVDTSQAIAAKITTGSAAIDLTRAGDQWRIVSPIQDAADPDQVQSLVRSLTEITAVEFYDGADIDRERFGLTQPQLRFEVHIGDREPIGFRLGANTTTTPPGFYLERIGDGQVAAVPEWVQTRFAKDVSALRDKRVFHCDVNDIAKISFERGDAESFALLRADDGTWSIDPPQDREVLSTSAERLVGGLATLAGKEIVSETADSADALAPFGLATPAVGVEISSKAGQSCGRVSAAQVGGDGENPAYYIKRAQGSTVMSVPAYLYSRLNMRAGDLLEPKKEPAAAADPGLAHPAQP